MDASLIDQLHVARQNEITEYHIYSKLAFAIGFLIRKTLGIDV
jgi:hypothetical protein